MPEPYGYTIFCDDIREEVGGKFSYMGRYFTEMLIPGAIPAVLPRLAAAVNFVFPRPQRGGLLRVVMSVETGTIHTIVHELTLGELPDDPNQSGDVLFSTVNLVVSPIIFHGDSQIRVRGYLDDREIKAGSLRVRIVPPPDALALHSGMST